MAIPASLKLKRQNAVAGGQQGKYWCFTINNPNEFETAALKGATVLDESKAAYIVCGDEVGEEKTPHIQGYIEFKGNKRLGAIKDIEVTCETPDVTFKIKIFGRAHLERRGGTAQQAADYCKKDGAYWEHGVVSNPEQVLPDTQPYDE